MSLRTCYNEFVTVTFGGALCFYPKSRLSVRASRDCDKHVETTGRRLFDSENTMNLYLLQSGDTECFKIGVSENIKFRISQLQIGNPHRIKLVASANTDREALNQYAAHIVEQALHNIFWDVRLCGEWFRLLPDEIEMIKESYRVLEHGSEDEIRGLRNMWIPMTHRHTRKNKP